MGAVAIWELSTTTDDAIIRNTLYEVIGSKNGIGILTDAFPSGSAANEVNNRMKNRNINSTLTIHEEIVQEIVRRYGPKYGNSKNQRLFD